MDMCMNRVAGRTAPSLLGLNQPDLIDLPVFGKWSKWTIHAMLWK